MPRSSSRKRIAINYNENDGPAKSNKHLSAEVQLTPPSRPPKRSANVASNDDVEPASRPTSLKKRRMKAQTADTMALARRTAVSSLKQSMYIGAHVSAAGGVQNAVTNAVQIGANSFGMFLKSQRKWSNPPITQAAQNGFLSQCNEHGYDASSHVLPHGSYLVNLAQADEEKARQAYDNFVEDLGRCEMLGIKLYNFHPGSTGGDTKAAAIRRIAAQLNKSHKATRTVITVLENMAGSGNVIGSTWEDLRDIIALVEDKSRVGVCIDTCHAFAAGYDLRTEKSFQETIDSFNDIVGAKYLKAFHLNDSKAPFNSKRDLHANIGTGFLGIRAFHSIMNHEPFRNMPMVLETPIEREGPDGRVIEDKQIWAQEIKLLESLIGMDVGTDEFCELEEKLQAKGAEDRQKRQDQADKRTQKGAGKRATLSNKAKVSAEEERN